MHKDFADWYRAASVNPASNHLESRWKGVEDATTALNSAYLLSLLNLFTIKPAASYQAPDFMDRWFRKHDKALPTSGIIEELRVLAGAILRNAIEKDAPAAIAAAYGLIAASFGGRRKFLPTPGHMRAAEQYLATKATAVRAVKNSPTFKIAQYPRAVFDEKFPPQHWVHSSTENLRDPFYETLGDGTARLNQGLNQVATSLWRTIQVQREELNFLWWLQNKFSSELGKPFVGFSKSEASVVLSMELADLTLFLPAPPSMLGVILNALTFTKPASKPFTIAVAVNSVDRTWRETRFKDAGLSVTGPTCPIMFALSKSIEVDGEDEWFPIYRKNCEVSVEDAMDYKVFATQVYVERLFTRALGELKK